MTPFGIFSSIVMVMALAGAAVAEETIKTKTDAGDAIAAQAKATSCDLGSRKRQAKPIELEEVDEMELQPLSVPEVQKVVRENLPRIQYCYDKAAAEADTPTGEVSLHLEIEATGKVGSSHVTAPGVNGSALGKCLGKSIKRWRFPATNTPTIVDYPLVFDVAGSTLADAR
jgi:hypothetical protein